MQQDGIFRGLVSGNFETFIPKNPTSENFIIPWFFALGSIFENFYLSHQSSTSGYNYFSPRSGFNISFAWSIICSIWTWGCLNVSPESGLITGRFFETFWSLQIDFFLVMFSERFPESELKISVYMPFYEWQLSECK